MSRARTLALLVPTVAAALALPAPAPAPAGAKVPRSAKLTPGGLGRIRVGMTERRVERVVGHRVKLHDLFGDGSCAEAGLMHGVASIFVHGRLARVTLTTRRFRTKSGLRVGMRQRAIRKRYGRRAKRSPHAYDPDGSYFKVTRGNRRLVFETDGSVITLIHGGRRPEVDYVEGCA